MFRRSKSLSPDGRSVVLTGASSGLGWTAALQLENEGFHVYAGVRREEDGEKLVAQSLHNRIHPVIMDVTKPDQIHAAADQVGGSLWGLINNAGVSFPGPLECVSPDRLRLQLETNVVGQLAVIQAFLPALRETRGRIVNVTSGLGRIALPYLGVYSAAQFAKEGMSDALRRELRPFGVTVSVVQPGTIVTPIWEKVTGWGQEVLDAGHPETDRYRDSFLRFLATNEQEAQNSKTRPEDFADVVSRALTDPRPRTRYPVGSDMVAASVLVRLLPDRLLDKRFASLV
ncbi:short-chain dehydrogenase [Actinophytocola xinjiangensis]|uniref:Short-chain dehydrogenase n=1 Tax=Actinophytocola xinjiangensis TaxID=485602 RepID=A0A7Z0WGK0_9PSEU|nr:SDR family oxidoreductase [Actinophytocola xinjiangensis]OLF05771.1 short-chain dehydrogenase [Actinophytocola xinjiangensis]